MLKFGKKVSYRPLSVSVLVACGMGLLFGSNISWFLGLRIGIIMFLLMFLGHYLMVLPIIFNYWDSTQRSIHYSDIKKLHKRFWSMLFPRFLPMKTINKNQIQDVSVIGLPQKDVDLNSELIITEEGGFLYNLLLMINDPIKIRLLLANNQTIDLDLSCDYVKRPTETLIKMRLFLNELNPDVLDISLKAKQALNM